MKKMLAGWVLLLVGALLLTTAVIMLTVLPGKAQRVPFNTNQTTHLSGEAAKYNSETGETDEFPVKVANFTKVDGKASNDDVVVWVSQACVNKDEDDPADCLDGEDPRVVSITQSVFATDRHTAEAVPDFDGLPAGTPEIEGLVNKFPFDTQKKDYTYWDDVLQTALPATFEGTEDFDGLEVYKFVVEANDEKAQVAELGGEALMGTYTTKVTVYIEPVTGAPVNQIQHQERYLDDGSKVIDLTVEFTDAQKKASIKDAKANVAKLNLFSGPLPYILLVVGLLVLVAGAFLSFRRPKNDARGHAA